MSVDRVFISAVSTLIYPVAGWMILPLTAILDSVRVPVFMVPVCITAAVIVLACIVEIVRDPFGFMISASDIIKEVIFGAKILP